MLDNIIGIIENSNHIWAYTVLGLSALIENIFPPAPADMVVVAGAYFVGRDILNGWAVYFVTTLGSTTGFMLMFGAAYWMEKSILEKRYMQWVRKDAVVKTERWFSRYGYLLILFNRFFAGFRSVISLVAGFTKLDFRKVLILSMISSAVWNGLLIWAGYQLGENWEKIGIYLKNYSIAIILIVSVTAIWYFFKKRIGEEK